MDYAGLVKALDPFWMDVIFELVPASGVFDGEVLSICDEDDWEYGRQKSICSICVLGHSWVNSLAQSVCWTTAGLPAKLATRWVLH